MPMDSRHLPTFLAVMRHRSIGRAAASIGITQSAASRILKRLEDEVGATLFERYSSGVVPTAYAVALMPFAEEIMNDSQAALEEIAALRGNGTSVARVGAVAAIASSSLPVAIDRLLKRWPNLRVQLLEGVDDLLSEALASGEIDIAIAGRMDHISVPFSRPNSLSDTLVVIARVGHPLADLAEVSLNDLTQYRWVLPPSSTPPGMEFARRFRESDIEPPIATVETRSISAIRSLVAATDMLAWQPRHAHFFEDRPMGITELNCAALRWTREFYIFKRQRGLLAPAAIKLIDEMRAMSGQRSAT